MPEFLLLPSLAGVAAGLAVALVFILLYTRAQRRAATGVLAQARNEAERARAEGAREAEAAKAEAMLAAKMDILKQREDLDREVQRRREEWERLENRAEERARAQERKSEEVDARERGLGKREEALGERELKLHSREGEADRLAQEQRVKLERIAGLTAEDARREILQRVEDEARGQAAALVRDIKEQARRGADREARRIISMAIQRVAAEHTAESTVAAVALPSDEMKGRIIGREGRNIRAFETATGVDVIIDDTPDTVIVSCFDPIRREVARRALEALIQDGRIHPGRIEEIVVKVQKELETQLVELGEQAAYDTGIHGLHPELIRLVGRMKYRTSYGQNIYDHSKEVAWLAGMMAAELHLDTNLAKRGGLLHDVGKVLTHDNEGTHVELGVEVARRYGESAAVINCIQAHHDDVPHETAESVLVQAADAISGSRPGARREAFETYVKRLTRLEEIANGF
ncbi:MAG: ribonuclease Y, partial [Gemmatimonadales bacterium]